MAQNYFSVVKLFFHHREHRSALRCTEEVILRLRKKCNSSVFLFSVDLGISRWLNCFCFSLCRYQDSRALLSSNT